MTILGKSGFFIDYYRRKIMWNIEIKSLSHGNRLIQCELSPVRRETEVLQKLDDAQWTMLYEPYDSTHM